MQKTTDPSFLSRRAQLAHGQPISDLMSRALANPELISLAAGFVDQESLPCEETHKALVELSIDGDNLRQALQYGTTPGYTPLREAILERLRRQDQLDDGQLDLDRVVMTAGSNQLLHLVSETLLDPGDIVLCSSPSYFVFLGTLQNLDVRAVGVATDEYGMLPESLHEQLESLRCKHQLHRVKAIYVVSYYDNPQGVSLAESRRQEIVELCRRYSTGQHHIYAIDDMAYRELRYEGDDLPSLLHYDPAGEHVIAAGTFSKSFSPGIRVGWGVLPVELIEPVCNLKGNIDFGSPNFNQHLMHQVLQVGLLDTHVERIRAAYRIKLEAMLEAADTWLAPLPSVHWIRPTGGLYVWLELPDTIEAGPTGQLFERAIDEGVLYVPGEYCFPAEGEAVRKNTMRLSFGVQTPKQIDKGMQALARAIRGCF
jgi:2-aminoadipate transaminase